MESDKTPHISFRRTFAWVVAAHVAVIIGISIWSWVTPGAPPPLKFISMVNAGDLVRGSAGPSTGPQVGAHPTPAMDTPPPAPIAQPPVLPPQEVSYQQPSKPEPQVEPTPAPEIPVQKPEPTLKTAEAKPLPPAPKPKPQVKVDLQEVTRADNASSSTAMSHHAAKAPRLMADASDAAISSLAVAEKLGASLRSSGVTGAVVSGKSGRRDGTDSDAGRYYTLIRDQMYDAWDRPLNLLGKGLCTQVRIIIEKSGVISNVELKRSSGNSQHDETAMAAVRKVGRIAEPLPEGIDGSVDINFKLAN